MPDDDHASRRLTARAWAKINLSLDVGPLRPDGFHEVRTILQTISLCDTVAVELTPAPGIVLSVAGGDVPGDERNLAWKAAARFLNEAGGLAAGVRVELVKRIPAQAGLGGGSSDAAAVLKALNHLTGSPLSHEALQKTAASLGSDVAFFLYGGTALAEGRGEILRPLPDAPRLDLVIVWTGAGVSTREAYGALDRASRLPRAATEAVMQAIMAGDRDGLLAAMGNHFEAVLMETCPASVAALDELRSLGARKAMLCGSGSAVFGVAGSRDEAESMAAELGRKWPFAVACSNIGVLEART